MIELFLDPGVAVGMRLTIVDIRKPVNQIVFLRVVTPVRTFEDFLQFCHHDGYVTVGFVCVFWTLLG